MTIIQLNRSEGEYKSNEIFLFIAVGKTHTLRERKCYYHRENCSVLFHTAFISDLS